MQVDFWLLDINQEDLQGVPEMRLWGINKKGRRVLIIDRSFRPHFYIIPKKAEDCENIIKKIRENKINVYEFNIEEKKLFGLSTKAVKVFLKKEEDFQHLSKEMIKDQVVKDVLHDDIRFSAIYLMENGIKPCGWHRVEAVRLYEFQDMKVDFIYLAKGKITLLEDLDIPNLRILAFSAIYHAEIGSPNPQRDPVLIISTLTNEGKEETFISEDFSDGKMLEAFKGYVEKLDPDVIVGFGSNSVDLPYINQRSKKNRLNLTIDRCGGEPHTSVYGHVSIVGRLNIDLLDSAKDMQEVKVKTLENIATFLGVTEGREFIEIRETLIHEYWANKDKRDYLTQLCKRTTLMVNKISDSILSFIFQLANLVGIPADYVLTAAVGFRVDWYLISKALSLGELIPKRIEQPYYPYKGGMVLEPRIGLHENIEVLDFSAMYPNIMVKYNISPDTFIRTADKTTGKVNVAPEVNHRFRADPPGFYKQVLSELMQTRKNIQRQISKIPVESSMYKLLEAKQRSIKVLTNATYGYCGWRGARWYVSEVSEATAAWGRQTITETIQIAREKGLDVVYGDTDSIFVKYDKEKVEAFLDEVKQKIGLEIRPEIIYKKIFFTEAKKRYAGLLADGKIDIVGLEVARGDWCDAAKYIQQKVLEIILRENDTAKASRLVSDYVARVRSGISETEPFIIWKTITKPIGEYEIKAPHVEAAKKMMQNGWKMTFGDKVGYVIVKGEGKLYERAEPYFTVEASRLDSEYYVENQIIPAALRILEIFNVTKEQLGSEKKSKGKKLDQFFH